MNKTIWIAAIAVAFVAGASMTYLMTNQIAEVKLEEPPSKIPLNPPASTGTQKGVTELEDWTHLSNIFRVFVYQGDTVEKKGKMEPTDIQYELIPENLEIYKKISVYDDEQKSVVVIPTFTANAYREPGFYTYFNERCDTSCLTQNIQHDIFYSYTSSLNGFKVLQVLGYDIITDIDLDKNPEIISKYDKVILLHNEYVTRTMFDAIDAHRKVLYLYPNVLMAEIETDYDANTIKLIRGHYYPPDEGNPKNGFGWEYDNTNPYEYDKECLEWELYKIDNGVMLNCYPELIIRDNVDLLKAIKDF